MRKQLVGFLFPLLLFVAACSSNGGNAVSPELQTTESARGAARNCVQVWGMWEITVDPATGTTGIVPLRHLEFTANVTQFLQPPAAAKHLLGIQIDPSSDFASGYVVVDVSLTHPFPGLDTYTGFDVRGVCIGNGSVAGVADGGILYAGEDDLRVLNADGLTRWFNPSEFTTYGKIFGFTLGRLGTPSYDFTATLNGYKYFCDQLESEDDVVEFFADPGCLNPRGFFSAGNTLRRKYELQFPLVGGAPEIRFQYAVIASWMLPDPDPPTSIPDDFSLSANCQEAYAVSTADLSTLYYVDPGDKGGELILEVTVYDHQGVEKSAGVHEEIARIHLESRSGLISGDLASFESGDLDSAMIESDSLKARYLLTVPETDVNPTASGDMPILVAVESVDPSSYDPGFPGFAFPPGALASYYMATVHVYGASTNEPPVAVADVVGGNYSIYAGQSLGFDGSDSYDPDGTIVNWEWESDGDDQYDDASGPNPTIQFPDGGVFYVDLRVTDDDGATDTLDDPIEITVNDKVIHVDDDNVTGPWDGSEEHPFLIVQDGIDAVPAMTRGGWSTCTRARTPRLSTIPATNTAAG